MRPRRYASAHWLMMPHLDRGILVKSNSRSYRLIWRIVRRDP